MASQSSCKYSKITLSMLFLGNQTGNQHLFEGAKTDKRRGELHEESSFFQFFISISIYFQASIFAKLGGINRLLNLTQSSNFNGFASLATLLVRHVMEDPATLRAAIERVIRNSTSNSNQGSNTKEFHYLLKMLAPAACRSPELFQDLSREILRVDFNLLSKRGTDIDDDQRLLIKSISPKSGSAMNQVSNPPLQEVSQSVICDLLNFLVQGEPETTSAIPTVASAPEAMDSSTGNSSTPGSANVAANRTQAAVIRNSSSGDLHIATTENVIQSNSSKEKDKEKEKEKTAEDDLLKKKQPLLSKSAVCRLLAELVKSYGSCAKLITEHIYEAGTSENVREDSSALAYLLDELLVSKYDKDLGPLIKTLVAALASCNQHADAQATLVSEVKAAISRALAWQESSQKHVKIQALTSLVSTMIESCPSSQNQQTQNGFGGYKQQFVMNNIVKIMLKRGLISDLARVAHSLDLSSPNVANTVNAALKPLEILTRIVNQPTAAAALPSRSGGGKSRASAGVISGGGGGPGVGQGAAGVTGGDSASQAANQGESAAGAAGTNTTNSEATRAQGDETVEPDTEATEHDVSTAAESIEPNSESQLQTVADGNDEVFDEMMDQLLERDSGQDPPILAEINIEHIDDGDGEQHDSQMMTQDESQFEAQQMSQDEEERESRSSHSDTENDDDDDVHEEEVMEEEDDDDGEDDEGDEDDEEEEDDEDEDEEEDDDDEDGAPFDDDENDEIHELEDAILRYPLGGAGGENDGDDIDLMIHYPDAADATATIHLDATADRTRSVHLPLWSDLGMASAHVADASAAGGGMGGNSHVTPSHPLLMGRSVAGGGGGGEAGTTGASRAARTLQRQRGPGFRGYIHLNSRGGGGHGGNPTAPAIIQNFLGGGGGGGGIHQDLGLRRGLLVDFGFAILDSLDENGIPDLEGNVLSSGGRAALNTIPAALVRWNEESRVIDGDSMHDCVTALKPSMLEVIEKAKEEELSERRAKKKKAQEEEEAKRKASEEEKKVAEAEKKEQQRTMEVEQQSDPAAVVNSESGAAPSTTASTEEPMAISPPTTSTTTVTGAAGTVASSSAAAPVQQTISETAVQLAEGLANAISAGVVNFPGISTATAATTTTTPSVAAAISAAAPFSTGALQVTWV